MGRRPVVVVVGTRWVVWRRQTEAGMRGCLSGTLLISSHRRDALGF